MTKARKLCVPRDAPLFPWVPALFSLPQRVTDRRAWHLSVYVTTIVFKHRPLCRFLFLAKIFLEMSQIYIDSNKYKRSILAISFEVKYCLNCNLLLLLLLQKFLWKNLSLDVKIFLLRVYFLFIIAIIFVSLSMKLKTQCQYILKLHNNSIFLMFSLFIRGRGGGTHHVYHDDHNLLGNNSSDSAYAWFQIWEIG